jgi:glycosyltransferase involved in cell wall biosynthesis
MKILLLSDTYSEHTEKWAIGLADKGFEIGLFSFNKASYEWYNHKNITVFFEPEKKINAESNLTKLAYLKYVGILKKIIKHFKPDMLHAHYATSYGLVGALSGFHPFIISSWGTDVMKFPQRNFIAKSILKYNFKSADIICATSNTIKEFIQQVTKKSVRVIPFGINIEEFKPKPVKSLFKEEDFVIGSIKPLERIYNCDILIKSFEILSKKHLNLKLLMIGEGGESDGLKKLCKELRIEDKVIFTGRIPFSKVSDYFNMINVLANLSEYESFGVSVVEAMACEKPVVVTNVGGLKEVVADDSVGLKVGVGDINETAAALKLLILNKEMCKTIGKNARKHVLKYYNWEDNLSEMISIYNSVINKDFNPELKKLDK